MIKSNIAGYQTYLPFVPFNMQWLVEEIRITRFPEINAQIKVSFIRNKPLAFIMVEHKSIFLHDILNHPQTPVEVFKYIITHELVHVLIRPREIDGKIVSHPPEFWQMLEDRCPERSESNRWIYFSFMNYIKTQKEKEGVLIKRNWKKYMQESRFNMEYFRTVFRDKVSEEICLQSFPIIMFNHPAEL